MIDVKPLTDARSFAAVERLYAEVFGGALNRRLLTDIAANSGRVRWSFDPMHARNAHFNTDVLGGRQTAVYLFAPP